MYQGGGSNSACFIMSLEMVVKGQKQISSKGGSNSASYSPLIRKVTTRLVEDFILLEAENIYINNKHLLPLALVVKGQNYFCIKGASNSAS